MLEQFHAVSSPSLLAESLDIHTLCVGFMKLGICWKASALSARRVGYAAAAHVAVPPDVQWILLTRNIDKVTLNITYLNFITSKNIFWVKLSNKCFVQF